MALSHQKRGEKLQEVIKRCGDLFKQNCTENLRKYEGRERFYVNSESVTRRGVKEVFRAYC